MRAERRAYACSAESAAGRPQSATLISSQRSDGNSICYVIITGQPASYSQAATTHSALGVARQQRQAGVCAAQQMRARTCACVHANLQHECTKQGVQAGCSVAGVETQYFLEVIKSPRYSRLINRLYLYHPCLPPSCRYRISRCRARSCMSDEP